MKFDVATTSSLPALTGGEIPGYGPRDWDTSFYSEVVIAVVDGKYYGCCVVSSRDCDDFLPEEAHRWYFDISALLAATDWSQVQPIAYRAPLQAAA